ncbi:hypothetical protein KQI68_06990 [Peptoniphilus sp. MSJ-1]|uniref:Uncharacterized protein n=1 Tax=Peptoniphilus ovalis TaxID=2841503 RepID=A0ABS6FJG8_9FIRM|nr:hypothetical protein [Peptoniphilus ovalis]MBU5669583.1 hypothetical protein [Peptoniphilus ovalis]
MEYKELETTAKMYGYKIIREKSKTILRQVHGAGINTIEISENNPNILFINNSRSSVKDFNMIKTATKYAETLLEERKRERTYNATITLKGKISTELWNYLYINKNDLFKIKLTNSKLKEMESYLNLELEELEINGVE